VYELRAYLPKRNDWPNDVYGSISWWAYGSASAGFTDSLLTFVVKLSHGWLLIGVCKRRCSATTDLCPQCNEIETVPHLYRCQARAPWRHRFLIHLHGHLIENDTKWFITGHTNDPVQIGWFQVLKGYIPKEWTSKQEVFYRRLRNTKKYYTGEQWTKELIEFVWTHGHTLWKDRCAVAHAPGEGSPDNSKRHNNGWKRHTHTLRSCWLMIDEFSKYHWKKDCNHEPPKYWRGLRSCYQLSTEAPARNYNLVIKTSAVISPKQQWPPGTTEQPRRQSATPARNYTLVIKTSAVISPKQQWPPHTT
jgi:hypothetical protein